jgi:hypothetical protein
VADIAPDATGKQIAVTALGGTQTGVRVSAAADPFTVTGFRPKVLKTAGVPNPVNGVLAKQPVNSYKVITRKGVIPQVGQAPQQMLITTIMEVPAGADTADPANVRAGLSMHIGTLNQQSSGLGDSAVSGVW